MVDFSQMTADEISAHKGPVYRASVRASRGLGCEPVQHDLESVSMVSLLAKIERLASGWRVHSVRFGPDTIA
jgi:hypothetical protein